MKIWLKLLIGIILGVIFSFVIPPQIGSYFFESVSQVMINIGRFFIFPLVLFSLIQGTYELKEEKKLFEVYGQLSLYLIASTLLLVIIGILSVLLFSPEYIQTTFEQIEPYHVPGLKETLLTAFPQNFFSALVGPGNILLPIIIIAIIFGSNLSFDKMITRPVVQVVDSLSRIFYQVNTLVVELFWIAIIFLTSTSIFNIRAIIDTTIFRQLLIILGIDMLVILGGIYPGLLYLLGERKNPYRWLYSITGPLLTALVTGDEYLVIGMLTKHGKENMGVSRKINSAVYPFFALFGRAGTALVASVSFILIMKSQSTFDIDFEKILWVIMASFLVSFALGSVPGMGSFVAISLLCYFYGKGLQERYLILKPIAGLLVCFGVVLDVATSAFTAHLIAHKKKVLNPVKLEHFV